MLHTFQLPKLPSRALTDFRLVQLEAERALNLGDVVGSAEWPQSLLRAGQLASEPGGAQESTQPPSPSYPGMKYIIAMFISRSPLGLCRKERGRGIHFLH